MLEFDSRRKIIELTLAVYRVTDKFPEREILREKIRDKALDFAGRLLAWHFCLRFQALPLHSKFQINLGGQNKNRGNEAENPPGVAAESQSRNIHNLIVDFEVLRAYFSIASVQNWLAPENFKVLENEYLAILNEIKTPPSGISATRKEKIEGRGDAKITMGARRNNITPKVLKEREKAIINCFKGNGAMRVGELSSIFSSLSKRTLRRDIERLCSMGILERFGSYNETAYKLKQGFVDDRTTLGQAVNHLGQVGQEQTSL